MGVSERLWVAYEDRHLPAWDLNSGTWNSPAVAKTSGSGSLRPPHVCESSPGSARCIFTRCAGTCASTGMPQSMMEASTSVPGAMNFDADRGQAGSASQAPEHAAPA